MRYYPGFDAKAVTGPFGPILRGYEGDWRGAALALEAMQDGEAPGALSHPEVGPIALVWGKAGTSRSDGYGLAKILAWHPEVLDNLQGRLSGATVVTRSENRIRLESEKDDFSVRLRWDDQDKVWLLTAYEREDRRSRRSTIGPDRLLDGPSPSQLVRVKGIVSPLDDQSPRRTEKPTARLRDLWGGGGAGLCPLSATMKV